MASGSSSLGLSPELSDDKIRRYHVRPRTQLFNLLDLPQPPGVGDLDVFSDLRKTCVHFRGIPGETYIRDYESEVGRRSLHGRWTGFTEFARTPVNGKVSTAVKAMADGNSMNSSGSQLTNVCLRMAGDAESSGLRALAASCKPVFPVPSSWEGIKRVLIEYCAPEDSELCKDTSYSSGCLNVRCTKSHNMAKASSIRSLLAFVQAMPPRVVICLWSGIPCTGGSPL